jgi:hypothetical protein
VKSAAEEYAGKEPLRIVVVGDTCLGEQGIAPIGECLKRYRVRGGTPGFHGIANFPLQIAGEFLQSDEGIR